jgi:MSHA biogenesis protein MshO
MNRQFRRWTGSRQSGLTLIELTIVIVLTGILAAIILQFVWPVLAYNDSTRRAALADTADTALRRIGRDLRLALPNSVRVTTVSGVVYMELLLVRVGGRYRSDSVGGTGTCAAAGDALSFGTADTCFTTLGDVPNISKVTTGDYLVVFNLQPGTTNADAYQFPGTGGNKSQITPVPIDGAGSEKITFASNTFTYESPGKRFFIIQGPVTYACNTAAQTLTRVSGYAIASTQPAPPVGGASALLASGVTGCSFTYDANASTQGAGLATMSLRLTAQTSKGGSETVTLYHTVHVNNVP